jgi:hypothetical protein
VHIDGDTVLPERLLFAENNTEITIIKRRKRIVNQRIWGLHEDEEGAQGIFGLFGIFWTLLFFTDSLRWRK